MRRMITAASTVFALALAQPSAAAVLGFGARALLSLELRDFASGGGVSGSGAVGELGTGLGELHLAHPLGPISSQVYGDDGELLRELTGQGLLTMDFNHSGSVLDAVATGKGTIKRDDPGGSAYFHYDYEMEYGFFTDQASTLTFSYENGDHARLYEDGLLVLDLDLNGQTGQQSFLIKPLAGYGLIFSGNTDHTVFVSGAGSSSGTDTAIYRAVLAVPEPATWALMIMGFGGVGAALRRRRQAATAH